MRNSIKLKIRNELALDQRDMTIYHQATKITSIISSGRFVSVTLGPEEDGDYLHISIPGGPGELKHLCRVSLPTGIDYDLSDTPGFAASSSNDRILLTIPPGTPQWQLKLTYAGQKRGKPKKEEIIILSDELQES